MPFIGSDGPFIEHRSHRVKRDGNQDAKENVRPTGKKKMRTHDSWTEDELRSEISRLGDLIEKAARCDDERSRCAASYLRQVLRDRCDSLTVLRHARMH